MQAADERSIRWDGCIGEREAEGGRFVVAK